MTADYPDYIRLFFLVGTTITIPINIESSDIILPISIDAATAQVDINIAAAAVMIDFNFADQSVAVFDAAKWFAHDEKSVVVWGQDDVLDNNNEMVASRVVPEDKVFYLCGVAYGMKCPTAAPKSTYALITYDGVPFITLGSAAGTGMIFDVPLRYVAGVTVRLYLWQLGSGVTIAMLGSYWGYDEDA